MVYGNGMRLHDIDAVLIWISDALLCWHDTIAAITHFQDSFGHRRSVSYGWWKYESQCWWTLSAHCNWSTFSYTETIQAESESRLKMADYDEGRTVHSQGNHNRQERPAKVHIDERGLSTVSSSLFVRMLLSIFSVFSNWMCVNQVIIDNRIFMQHARS